MKHRSVSKVRSTKLAKKNRFVAKQVSNADKSHNHPERQVWVSNVFIKFHTDPETKAVIPTMIIRGNGTYCRAKHDIKDTNGRVTRRYVAN